jgi:hypothetical protein
MNITETLFYAHFFAKEQPKKFEVADKKIFISSLGRKLIEVAPGDIKKILKTPVRKLVSQPILANALAAATCYNHSSAVVLNAVVDITTEELSLGGIKVNLSLLVRQIQQYNKQLSQIGTFCVAPGGVQGCLIFTFSLLKN